MHALSEFINILGVRLESFDRPDVVHGPPVDDHYRMAPNAFPGSNMANESESVEHLSNQCHIKTITDSV